MYFEGYDWDGPLVGDDLLGVAKLNLSLVKAPSHTCATPITPLTHTHTHTHTLTHSHLHPFVHVL